MFKVIQTCILGDHVKVGLNITLLYKSRTLTPELNKRFCYDIFSFFFIVDNIFCEKKQGTSIEFEYIFQCGFVAVFEFMHPYVIIEVIEIHSCEPVYGLYKS